MSVDHGVNLGEYPDRVIESVYFRRLLCGRDVARDHPFAGSMANFVYLLGDRSLGECVIVDPAYAIDELIAVAENDGMRVVGALATHYHPDHVGGEMMGHRIEGIEDLLERIDVPIHANRAEVPWITKVTGVGEAALVAHDSGDRLAIGDLEVEFLHTPGHTPGSQCFLFADRLVSGDTLFLDGCGRTDLPGGDASELYRSLVSLAALPDHLELCPGHRYSPSPSALLRDVKRDNSVFHVGGESEWTAAFAPRR
jgi:hydroxyacylglutathione hydrolase